MFRKIKKALQGGNVEEKIKMDDVLDFIKGLSESEQEKIYKYTVGCIKELRKEKSIQLSANFRIGQRVCWQSRKYGTKIFGAINRINPKSASVTEEGKPFVKWSVSYSFLRDATAETKNAIPSASN